MKKIMTIQKYLKNRFGQIENKRKPLTSILEKNMTREVTKYLNQLNDLKQKKAV